jgi:ferredoxin--NADP+ reductase
LNRLLDERKPDIIRREGWRAIDLAEREHGKATGRPRVKLTAIGDMITVAQQG